MKYTKAKNGSYFYNNILILRENDRKSGRSIIHQDRGGSVRCMLNGYAIIPLEEYYQLEDEHGEDGNNWPDEMLKNIEEADKQLHEE